MKTILPIIVIVGLMITLIFKIPGTLFMVIPVFFLVKMLTKKRRKLTKREKHKRFMDDIMYY